MFTALVASMILAQAPGCSDGRPLPFDPAKLGEQCRRSRSR